MKQTVRVMITGCVQGVGYRAWTRREAVTRGIEGWVRNRQDGSVEAVFSAEAETVASMLEACRQGPAMAIVERIESQPWLQPVEAVFEQRPTYRDG